jgi:H2-forming N5,N10-methylenetetrahydromethanopterin dehydrogenase-like enzyme
MFVYAGCLKHSRVEWELDMKNKFTFFVVSQLTGTQKRISINKQIIYCVIILAALLMCSGIFGAWKYRENIEIKKKCLLLEAEKARLEAVARTVKEINKDESTIRGLLGLENVKPDSDSL